MVSKANAAHILVKTEQEANELKGRLSNGEKFDALAKKYSLCPSGKKGGDLGWFGRGEMVREFETAAFNNKVGDIVGPIKTQFGYHLILVKGQK